MNKRLLSPPIIQIGVIFVCLQYVVAFYSSPNEISMRDEETFLISDSDEDLEEGIVPVSAMNLKPYEGDQIVPVSAMNLEPREGDQIVPISAMNLEPHKGDQIVPVSAMNLEPYGDQETTQGHVQADSQSPTTSQLATEIVHKGNITTFDDDSQIGRVTLKTIYYNGTEFSDENYDYEKLKSEYYDQISGELEAVPRNATQEESFWRRNWMARKVTDNWRTILKWSFLSYAILVIPLWCWRGWCLCCFQCQFCFPDEIVWEAKHYIALNPPGVFLDADGKEIKYTPSRYEEESYHVLYRSIHRYAA
nr:PREDICTED: uncharacterized protein LOC109036662 [Bemisia tabaci]